MNERLKKDLDEMASILDEVKNKDSHIWIIYSIVLPQIHIK